MRQAEYTLKGEGFYRSAGDGQNVIYAPNSVVSLSFELYAEKRSTYSYPVSGWTWYDTEVQARIAMNLPATPNGMTAKSSLV